MKVTRRPLVMTAQPPTQGSQFYMVTDQDVDDDGQPLFDKDGEPVMITWPVEKRRFMRLYQLSQVSDPDAELL